MNLSLNTNKFKHQLESFSVQYGICAEYCCIEEKLPLQVGHVIIEPYLLEEEPPLLDTVDMCLSASLQFYRPLFATFPS
jgi:hypothetical protein